MRWTKSCVTSPRAASADCSGRWCSHSDAAIGYPNDALGHEVASLLLEPSDTRDRLTEGAVQSPMELRNRKEFPNPMDLEPVYV